jgi:NAD-specific glutamate dehydrogenase
VDASRQGIHQALVELDQGVGEVARYLMHSALPGPDAGRVERWRAGLDALRDAMSDYLSEGEALRLGERRARLESQGLPQDLAAELAGLALADRGLNILLICEHVAVPPIGAARAYAKLGDETGINWVYARLTQADGASLLDLQRRMTESLIRRKPDDLDGAVADYLAEHAERIERVHDLQRRASVASPSALSAIASELRPLRPVESESRG